LRSNANKSFVYDCVKTSCNISSGEVKYLILKINVLHLIPPLIGSTLVQDSSGSPRSLSRTEFVDQAWSSVGRGSQEEYGLLFDSVVFTQEHGSLLVDVDAIKEEGRVDWGGLSSFLLQELSDKVKNSRTRSGPRWKPVRTLTCPHRDPVQKVRGH